MNKTLKVSLDVYTKLNNYAGLLRMKEKKPISLNEALRRLLSRKSGKGIESYAGTWKMSKKEAVRMKKDIKEVWKTWKL